MNRTVNWRQRRFAIVGWIGRLGCIVIAIGLPVAVVAVWSVDALLTMIRYGDGPLPSLPFRVLGGLVSLPPVAIIAWGLLRLSGLFGLLAAGMTLTREGAARLQDFAFALLLGLGLNLFAQAGASMAMTWERGEGERALSIAFSSDGLLAALIGLLLLAVSWLLTEAAELSEDSASIV
ncbi:MAG: hypothetical protein AAF675_17540 [Pseudomonadota bacterium]